MSDYLGELVRQAIYSQDGYKRACTQRDVTRLFLREALDLLLKANVECHDWWWDVANRVAKGEDLGDLSHHKVLQEHEHAEEV